MEVKRGMAHFLEEKNETGRQVVGPLARGDEGT
jgi:hypothetical protein